MSSELAPRYQPSDVESRWYGIWESRGWFRPESAPADRPKFVIVIPPPNVTGALHMGHALNGTCQDVLIRHARMRGFRTLWVPGTDHAGIATQNVVEKTLRAEGTSREGLGREAFLERVWAWKREYGDRIVSQLKRLGCSCDWERTRFTMDDGLSRAVSEVFIRLFEKGLIYRGERLINWCPRCLTALSDEEAEAREEKGTFWRIRYRVVDSDRFIVVATTRPETMLGDTAVAVHPEDPRFEDLVGRSVEVPLTGRRIPVIADTHADPARGSGAVKITPAHDFNDFEVAERHDLPRITVMDERGRMNDAAGAYAGLDRFEARRRILADLGLRDLLDGEEPREIPLPRCYRCDSVVEPRLSHQWFVRMRPLMEPAARAVREGRTRFVPERYARTYFDWVEQYKDWCISRQLWWGHRIPVWHCACGGMTAAHSDPDRCRHCGGTSLTRDPDVLDTWFSSALWPFSTLGWPDETPDLRSFYPTDVLVTARDIIYFWVARMMMAGLEFLGREPFHTVYVTGTVLDASGRRMSKSLGNGIDPVEMGDRYGMDAVRFCLVMLSTEGQDLRLSESRFEMGRNFANKLWNAARFVLMNTADFDGAGSPATILEDRWILSRGAATVAEVSAALGRYDFNGALRAVYEFTWNDFCDWYLETAKTRLAPAGAAEDRRTAQGILVRVLDTVVRLLHPFVPFVTEEIWQKLRGKLRDPREALIIEDWPVADAAAADPEADRVMGLVQALVRGVRHIRNEVQVPEKARVDLVVKTPDADAAALLLAEAPRFRDLGRFGTLAASPDAVRPPCSATVVVEGLVVWVPLEGLIDIEAEKARLHRRREEAERLLGIVERKLDNPDFAARAPEEIVERERERRREHLDLIAKIDAGLDALR